MVKQEVEDQDTKVALKTENKDLLSQFYKLVSLDESVRIKAVVSIIENLRASKKETDIDYALQRLVQGLGSSRKAARQGYASALTHLISDFKDVSTERVLKLLAEHLVVTGSSKGQEERDNYFGQVFGYIAVCKSKTGEDMDGDFLKIVLENLVKLSKKKSYLQEICSKAIIDILPMVKPTIFSSHILPVLEPVLKHGWSKCSPDQLLIVLKVQEIFKDVFEEGYFAEHWKNDDLLASSNYEDLAHVLMETTNTAHPRVHILWNTILKSIIGKNRKKTMEKFWERVVEENLMQSTHERKFLAVNLLNLLISEVPANLVGVVFSKGLVRCIINSCQSKENYLNSAVKDMLKKLPQKVTENPDKKSLFEVIKCLVGRNGNVLFDSITHTKTIENLTLKLEDNLCDYFTWLKEVLQQGCTYTRNDDDAELLEKEIMNCRGWVANQLYLLIRCCKSKNEQDLLMNVLECMFVHAYFNIIKKTSKISQLGSVVEKPHLIPHATFQQRFLSALNEVTHFHVTKQNQAQKVHGFGGVASDGNFFAMKLLRYAHKLLQSPKYVSLNETWTPDYYDAFENSMSFLDTTESNDSENVSKGKGTQLLFIHTTLQLFSCKPEAIDILQDLHTCYARAEEKKKKKKTEPHWTEVLTEILLGYIIQPSHLLRQVVDMVFPSIALHLSQEAFNLLIEAIKPKKKTEEDGGIEIENESDDESELHQEKKEEPDGEENGENVSDDDDNNADDGGDDSDGSDDETDSDMEVDEKFKAELKNALGDSAANSEEDDSDAVKGEEEDMDMDACDEKYLLEMDKALAAVFRARKQRENERKDKKSTKVSVLHFKLRVLDLLEIFIKKYPEDPKVLTLIEPLLEVLKTSHGHISDLALFDRTLGIYKNKLCQLHEYPSGGELNVEEVHQQIERLVKLAKTASSALFVNYITLGVVYLIRVLRGNPELKEPSPLKTRSQRKRNGDLDQTITVKTEDGFVGSLDEERVVSCYREALVDFMSKRSSHLQPTLFIETIQRFPEFGWKLVTILPQYLNEGCNNFRKVKACEIIKIVLSKKTNKFCEHLSELSPVLLKNLCKAFTSTKEKDFSLKARQFHNVVHLADVFVKEAMKIDSVRDKVDLTELKQSLRSSLDSTVVTRSLSLQGYCQTVINGFENFENGNVSPKKKTKK